jgi:hypothetical protein
MDIKGQHVRNMYYILIDWVPGVSSSKQNVKRSRAENVLRSQDLATA